MLKYRALRTRRRTSPLIKTNCWHTRLLGFHAKSHTGRLCFSLLISKCSAINNEILVWLVTFTLTIKAQQSWAWWWETWQLNLQFSKPKCNNHRANVSKTRSIHRLTPAAHHKHVCSSICCFPGLTRCAAVWLCQTAGMTRTHENFPIHAWLCNVAGCNFYKENPKTDSISFKFPMLHEHLSTDTTQPAI